MERTTVRWPWISLAIVLAVLLGCNPTGPAPSPAANPAPNDDSERSGNAPAGTGNENCIRPYVGLVVTKDTVICPGEYELDSGDAAVITVAGSHLTLVGDGVTLIGTAAGHGSAITLAPGTVSNVVIRGFTLSNYYYGVYALGDYHDVRFTAMVIDRPVYGPFDVGAFRGSDCRFFLDDIIVIDSRTTGIMLRECKDCELCNITSVNTTLDVMESNIILAGGENNTIEDCYLLSANESGCNAIWLSDSRFNVIQNNILDLDFKDGSHLNGRATGNEFRNNTFVLRSAQKAFFIPADCPGNRIYGNTFIGGLLDDRAPDTVFCVDGAGNSYEDDASYQGASPTGGTCP